MNDDVRYVILYETDPAFKGVDAYLCYDDGGQWTLLHSVEKAHTYGTEEEAASMCKTCSRFRGHLPPRVAKVTRVTTWHVE